MAFNKVSELNWYTVCWLSLNTTMLYYVLMGVYVVPAIQSSSE